MCEKCKSIDEEIERYRTLGGRATDPQSLKGIHILIEKMEQQKKDLHPDE
jgi:hypothetical protein